MICPNCDKDIEYLNVKSWCSQRASYAEVDGKVELIDFDPLDVQRDGTEIACWDCGFVLAPDTFTETK